MSKDLPSLAVLVPEAVTCENNFSGMSDSGDDIPALQSAEEEEEDEPTKFKIKVSSNDSTSLFYIIIRRLSLVGDWNTLQMHDFFFVSFSKFNYGLTFVFHDFFEKYCEIDLDIIKMYRCLTERAHVYLIH